MQSAEKILRGCTVCDPEQGEQAGSNGRTDGFSTCRLQLVSSGLFANEAAAHYATMLADNGQFGLVPDGITLAGILPGIILEKDE